ncbi:5'-3' exonuclease [Acinetobacter brisouii]|uniref:5'-3' exonuclease n=1 Tax=Acinetobacter brisouii TaxID=396323 RepID=UPI00124CB3D7|nr:5'-3' exonuclease [Acinetobacter brisouii]
MNLNLLIDGNSLGFAAHHGTTLSANGMQTQAIFNVIKMVRQLMQEYPQASFLVIWDGKAKHRFDLLPTYKGDRADTEKKVAEREAYKVQQPHIQRALELLGIPQIRSLDHEADDIAGIMTNRLMSKPNNRVLLVSGDQDWIQLIREGVSWRDLRRDDRVVNMQNIFEKTGYKSPISFLEGKALHGDSSDCISGVGGIGETGAPLLLAEHGSITNFWKKCDSGEYTPRTKAEMSLWKGTSDITKEQWLEKFSFTKDDSLTEEENQKAYKKALKKHSDAYIGQGRKLFIRNLQLMQLLNPHPLNKERTTLNKGKFDQEGFLDFCGEMSFMSIIRTIDNFVQPFKRQTNA